jgi:hypothetical protein
MEEHRELLSGSRHSDELGRCLAVRSADFPVSNVREIGTIKACNQKASDLQRSSARA